MEDKYEEALTMYEKALNHMEDCKYENRCKNCKMKIYCTFEKDHKLLQELVDKEIPVKPEKTRQNISFKFPIYRYSCAKCGNDINHIGNYCSSCGQKIDWSDEK